MGHDQINLFGGSAHARRTDPETSHEAAGRLKQEDLSRGQKRVLCVMHEAAPATDEVLLEASVALRVKISPSGFRTRRTELVAKGLVEDSGGRRDTKFGNPAIVWRLTRKGRFVAADMASRRRLGELD